MRWFAVCHRGAALRMSRTPVPQQHSIDAQQDQQADIGDHFERRAAKTLVDAVADDPQDEDDIARDCEVPEPRTNRTHTMPPSTWQLSRRTMFTLIRIKLQTWL